MRPAILIVLAFCVLAGCGDDKATNPSEANCVFSWCGPPGGSCTINGSSAYVHNVGTKRAVDVTIKTRNNCTGLEVEDGCGDVDPGEYRSVSVAGGGPSTNCMSVLWINWH